ncbi:hypothetical protein PS627_00167 [Pseudomonas fluorescens]|nr:hypothetical protein PS627_00167 [Pseudomonas fluorescens]
MMRHLSIEIKRNYRLVLIVYIDIQVLDTFSAQVPNRLICKHSLAVYC